jgi:hypothetical protein
MGPPRTLVGRAILYRRASVQKWLAAQEQHYGRGATNASEKSDAREPRTGA